MTRSAIVLGAALFALTAVATGGELQARASARTRAALNQGARMRRAEPIRPSPARTALPLAAPRTPLLPVPAGQYSPFYKDSTGTEPIAVSAFAIDARPVTTLDFHVFLVEHSEWRRSQVTALFAEPGYLGHWSSDLDFSPAAADAPVTRVSWFAAKAYCAAHGERLPTIAEWERAASLGLLGDTRSVPGEGSLWEWTYDFNSVLVAGGDGDSPSLFCGAGARSTRPEQYAEFLRYAFRSSLKANFSLKNMGFRCAREAS